MDTNPKFPGGINDKQFLEWLKHCPADFIDYMYLAYKIACAYDEYDQKQRPTTSSPLSSKDPANMRYLVNNIKKKKRRL